MQGRIIKFRAYDELTKIWSYFDLDSIEQDESYRTYLNGMKKSDKTIIEQYTGLKDKNGKEIYEGDIVNYIDINTDDIETSQILWDEENCCFCIRMSQSMFANQFSDEYEVIGNIHENTELLNG